MPRRSFIGCLILCAASTNVCLGADTTYTYDALGRLVSESYSSGGSTSYTYDAAGNRTASATAAPGHFSQAGAAVRPVTRNDAPITFDPREKTANLPVRAAIAAAGVPSHGTVKINGGASLTYRPVRGNIGSDSFNYTVIDRRGRTTAAAVTVTVMP